MGVAHEVADSELVLGEGGTVPRAQFTWARLGSLFFVSDLGISLHVSLTLNKSILLLKQNV